MKALTQTLKELAQKEGFHLVGVASAKPSAHISIYERWIEKNYHADMDYLKRHLAWKKDPRRLFPDAKSILMCGLSYKTKFQNPAEAPKDKVLISNYAWGEDYHHIMKKKLKNLLREIQKLDSKMQGKIFCDTSAILERSYAYAAGLGWIGKNTMVMDKRYGSYFFIGGILLNQKFLEDQPQTDHCGTCTKCIEACPTGALQPYELDATKCISYLTIEKKGDFTRKEKKYVQSYVFGCDICQLVCPWNDHAQTPDLEVFRPKPNRFMPHRLDLNVQSEDEFLKIFEKSPIRRAKYQGLKRNLKALQNTQYLK